MADFSSAAPKLYYFKMRGRAEIVRLVFAAADMKFEDCRVSHEEWKTYKSSSPFGQMPFLEINGQFYGQSVAIATYAAREGGLYGDTNVDGLKIDQVMQLMQDLINVISCFYHEEDAARKQSLVKKLQETDAPKFYGFFEKIIKNNQTGYVVGNKLTLADIAIYELINSTQMSKKLKLIMPTLDAYPMMRKVEQKVASNPKVKAYVESRPTSDE